MRRSVEAFARVFFALLLIRAATPAAAPTAAPDTPESADPFCSVTLHLTTWDTTANQEAPASAQSLLGQLSAPGAFLSAHIVMITDTDAYEAAIPTQTLSGSAYFRETPKFLITFPKTITIRYAYVDSYGLDKRADTFCPTEPQSFGKRIGDPEVAPDLHTIQKIEATFRQTLPRLPCGKAYIPAHVKRAVTPVGFRTDARRVARIAIFVNSDGSIAKSYVYKSSGVDYADMRAVDAANRTEYTPAQFLCTPVVGEYLYTVDYMP